MTRHIPPQPDLNLRARLACALAVQGAPHAIVSGVVDLGEYLEALQEAAWDHDERGNPDVRDGLRAAWRLLEAEAPQPEPA